MGFVSQAGTVYIGGKLVFHFLSLKSNANLSLCVLCRNALFNMLNERLCHFR